VDLVAEHEAQAVMAGQLVGRRRRAALVEIGRRCAQDTPVRRCQRQGYEAGARRLAIAKGRLPLTAIAAWEMLFDRLGIAPGKQPSGKTLLIIGASGGVGSIMTQLAARLTSLTLIGTASRPETQAWAKELGAHHVIDHGQPIAGELKRIGFPTVGYIVSLTQTDAHFAQIVEAIAPQGKFGLIDDPVSVDVTQLKRKAVSLHWEFMFTRALFGTEDMIGQHRLLNEVAGLVDAGLIRTTLAEHFGSINAANLKRAHARSSRARRAARWCWRTGTELDVFARSGHEHPSITPGSHGLGRHRRPRRMAPGAGAAVIVGAGGRDGYGPQQTQGFSHEVALAPLDLLAGVKADHAPCAVPRGLRASMVAAVGSALRPIRSHHCWRSRSCMASLTLKTSVTRYRLHELRANEVLTAVRCRRGCA